MAKGKTSDSGKHTLVSNGATITIKPAATETNGHSIDYYRSETPKDVSSTDKCSFHPVLVVLASATINGTIFGVVNSFGVLYVYLLDMFRMNQDYDEKFLDPLVAGIGSLCVGLIFFCSIIASILTDRYGVRKICFTGGLLAAVGMYTSSLSTNLVHLYITYGVILGVGGSLAYAPSLVILGHYYKKHLGLANGIVTAGSSIFTVIMPIVLKKLLVNIGIQTTLAYLSALMSLLMVCAMTFEEKMLPESTLDLNSGSTNGTTKNINTSKPKKFILKRSLWRNKLYLLWVISISTALFGYFVPFVHLMKHVKDKLPDANGEILVTCIGAFSGIGRFVTGPIADISNVNRIVLQQVAFVSIGVLTMTLTVADNFPLLLVICCGLGLFDGCFISLLGPIAFDLVGPSEVSQAIGFLLCFCSFPLTVGPPVAAYLYDLNSNYTLAFILAGIPPLIGSLLMVFLVRIQQRFKKTSSTGPIEKASIESHSYYQKKSLVRQANEA